MRPFLMARRSLVREAAGCIYTYRIKSHAVSQSPPASPPASRPSELRGRRVRPKGIQGTRQRRRLSVSTTTVPLVLPLTPMVAIFYITYDWHVELGTKSAL